MTANASLTGKMPDPDLNGLGAIAGRCRDNPTEQVTVVAVVAVRKVEHDHLTGDDKVKFEVEHIEPVEGGDRSFVESLLRAATEHRTGKVPIDGFNEGMAP